MMDLIQRTATVLTLAMGLSLGAITAQAAQSWPMGKQGEAWRTDNFAAATFDAHQVRLLCGPRNGLITSQPMAINADDYAFAEIHYHMTGVNNILHLLFAPQGSDDDFGQRIYTAPLLNRETYKPGKILIPLRGRSDWQGVIGRLRLVLPLRNEGSEFTLLGVALRKHQDWLENGALAALRPDGQPWGWDHEVQSGQFHQSARQGQWTFTAQKPGRVVVRTALPHIRQDIRYRLSLDAQGSAKIEAAAVLFDRHDKQVQRLPLIRQADGQYQLRYDVDRQPTHGHLEITLTADRAGQSVTLHEATLENLGGRLQWQAEWIWGDAHPKNEQACHFQKTFEVDDPAAITSALLQVTCDDHFGLWLNGQRVAKHNLWAEPQIAQVKQHLRKGTNVIQVRGYNRGGIGALLAELRLDHADGSPSRYIHTDNTWLTSFNTPTGPRSYEQPDNLADWTPAHSFGRPPVMPWGQLTLHETLPAQVSLPPVDKQRIAAETTLARVNRDLDYPRIELNGQPAEPLLYGSRWLGDRTLSFLNSVQGGFKLYRLSWELGEGWRPDGSLDLTSLDREVEENLRHNPEARLIIAFRITAPSWWMAKYPEDLCRYSDGTVNGHYGLLPSMASQRWLADAQRQVQTLVRHVESSWYASRIIAYMPCSHSGPEWVMTNKQAALPDYSQSMVEYFRAFLRRKYDNDVQKLRAAWGQPEATFDNAAIPAAERRGPRDAWLLDPARDADVIDYNRAHNESTGDAIMRMMQTIRQDAPRKLTMVYYGYTMTLTQLGFYPNVTGHYDLERVLASGLVDIFASPVSYIWRAPGDISGIGAMQDTFRRHGAVWLQEADNRTSLTADSVAHKLDFNLRDAIIQNRREFAYALVHRLGVWYYDMQGGWFDNPVYTDDFQRMHALYRDAIKQPVTWRTPVAVFFDEKSLDVTSVTLGNYSTNAPRTLHFDFQRGLARAGLPYDILAQSDVYDTPADQYKVLIFVNAYLPDRKFIEHVHRTYDRPGTTLVFLYAPGMVGGDVEAASAMTGLRLAKAAPQTGLGYLLTTPTGLVRTGMPRIIPPVALQVTDPAAKALGHYTDRSVAVATKTLPGGGTSVFATMSDSTGALWRLLWQQAGLTPMVDRADRVAFDGQFLCLFAMDAPGVRTLTLPVAGGQVIDAFDGRVIAEDARRFQMTLEPGQTVLLQIRRP